MAHKGRTPGPRRHPEGELARIMMDGPPTAEMIALFRQMQDAPPLGIRINPLISFYLVSTLQLALRNPQFPAGIAVEIENVARSLQRQLGEGNPLLYDMLDLGWDRAYDVP